MEQETIKSKVLRVARQIRFLVLKKLLIKLRPLRGMYERFCPNLRFL